MKNGRIMTNKIQINQRMWSTVIESQEQIFTKNSIQKMSEHFRKGHNTPDGQHCVVDLRKSDCHLAAELKDQLFSRVCGYDLPHSYTDEGWNGRYLAFCFQDPLRTYQANNGIGGISAGVPFALSSEKNRNGFKGYGIVWQTILATIAKGYGVWLTDARKLWINPKTPLSKESEKMLNKVQRETLNDEITRLKPYKTVAFGHHAYDALTGLGIQVSSCQLHPSVQGLAPWSNRYNNKSPMFAGTSSPDERRSVKVNAYVNEIGI